MPAKAPPITDAVGEKLRELGERIHAHRKALRISAVSTAEAAGMSRVTLHRIEQGEPSVTMGAYLNAMAVLGLDFGIAGPSGPGAAVGDRERRGWIPACIRLEDYPQLRQLAWQIHGTDALTPARALRIYERNWRHLDLHTLDARERNLVEALGLGGGSGDV